MEKLIYDSGVREFQVNNDGVLRFNPTDPNVFDRFLDAQEKLMAIENELVAKGKNDQTGNIGAAIIRIMAEADRRAKAVLADVFGAQNDFDKILGGVNLMAVGANGERVVTNFVAALMPIMKEGARECASRKVETAVEAAQLNRAQRQAVEK